MDNDFKLIAIRVNGDDSVGQRKLKCGVPYYFRQGYTIEESKIIEDFLESNKDIIYSDYFCDSTSHPIVHISAIVGENGAGKSTIIEYMMRLINNFATATFGDLEITQKAYARLHFIDGIKGSLFYRKGDAILELKVWNRNVKILKYESIRCSGNICTYMLSPNPFFDNNGNVSQITPSYLRKISPWKGVPNLYSIYDCFFYTFVSNYSSYAYNTLDFQNENDYVRNTQGELVRRRGDSYNWLHGLFHKNDGYQCPIVLSPFRNKGNIDINNENYLSRERLITLLIQASNNFSLINGHLRVIGFTLKHRHLVYDAHKLRKDSNDRVLYSRLTILGWKRYRELIPYLWMELLNLSNNKVDQGMYAEEAWDYITYKTLKIAAQYRQYKSFYEIHQFRNSKIDEVALKKYIKSLIVDHSHITKKIRQTLAYLEYRTYEVHNPASDEFFMNINEIREVQQNNLNNAKNKQQCYKYVTSIEDLVPPPIFDTKINLIDINTKQSIQFETLSSGEKQQAYTISSILYHLENLNSVHNDLNGSRITYSCCNIVLEELEMYFHPELQKNLIRYLLDGIKQVSLTHISAINICVVTHSPFVLSDIPKENILGLNKNGDIKSNFNTFAANIHDMLKTSFLPSGSIGDYAQWLINRIIICLRVYDCLNNEKKYKFKEDANATDELFIKKYFSQDGMCENRSAWKQNFSKEYIYERIAMLDEPIIRQALLKEYERLFGNLSIEQKIAEYQHKILDLQIIK